MKDIILIPTYNEHDNIQPLLEEIFLNHPQLSVMVIDDNSPDGTADVVKNLQTSYPNLRLLQRPQKNGLGNAYKEAMSGLAGDLQIRSIITMDADGSHPVSTLKDFLAQIDRYGLIIGSRYVKGGGVSNWDRRRRLLSAGGNFYNRLITGLGPHDLTAGFMCIRRDTLAKIDLSSFAASGYSFLLELKFRLIKEAGARFLEVPIIFTERRSGESKLSGSIIREGLLTPWRLRFNLSKEEVKNKNIPAANSKILVCTGIYPPDIGGPATYVSELINGLPPMGFDLRVITYSDVVDDQAQSKIYRINRHRPLLVRYFNYFRLTLKLCFWADLVYIQGPVSEGLPAALACGLSGKKYILKIVGDFAWEQGSQRYGVKDNLDDFQSKKYGFKVELWRRIERWVAKRAVTIITPSYYLKKIVSGWISDTDKIRVVYNSVAVPVVAASRDELRNRYKLSGLTLLTVGRLVPWKGIEMLIDLVDQVREEMPDLQLIVAGDGPERKLYEQKITERQLSGHIRILGSIGHDNVLELMKAADILVLNSSYEGLSHVLIEGILSGLPIIASRVGGNQELLENYKGGRLVSYNQLSEFIDAVKFLRCQPLYQDSIKPEEFSRSAMFKATAEILREQLVGQLRVLSFGLDQSALDQNSALVQRAKEYSLMIGRYDLVVPDKNSAILKLSDNSAVYGSGGRNKLFQLFEIIWLGKKLIKRNNYSLISVQDSHYLALGVWLLSRWFGLPLEIQVHGFEREFFCRRQLARFLLRRADGIRTVSQRLKNILVKDFNVSEDKIYLRPIANQLVPAELEAKANQSGKFIFLTVGRLVPVKDHGLQFAAIKEIIADHPSVELWVAGSGPLQDEYEKNIGDLGLAGQIKLLGHKNQAELSELYRQADCFLLTSRQEGYGVAILEAASFGLPIIMTDVGLAGEVIEDDKNGLIIPVGDRTALTAAMSRIINDEFLARRLGQEAYKTSQALSLADSAERFNGKQRQEWQNIVNSADGRSVGDSWRRNWLILLIITFFVIINCLFRFYCFGFTFGISDSYQYLETAKLFSGVSGEIFPQRILKPLAPALISLLSLLTNRNFLFAFISEIFIFYWFMAIMAYVFFKSFFKAIAPAFIGTMLIIFAYPVLNYGLDLYTETGAWFFWFLAIYCSWLLCRRLTLKRLIINSLIIAVGLLWKEYSILGYGLMLLVIFFHPDLGIKKKIVYLAIGTSLIGAISLAWQIIVFFVWHYSYFDWLTKGNGFGENSEYSPFFILKSLLAVYLLAWPLVVLGLTKWLKFSGRQSFFLLTLLPPSLLFLLWGGVSSRLYFVVAPLLTLLAINGLFAYVKNNRWRFTVLILIILANYFWLIESSILRRLIIN